MVQVAGLSKALSKLRTWAEREEWEEPFKEVFGDHLAPACEALDIEPDELLAPLGEYDLQMVFNVTFEDFLTCDLGEDGRNLIDHYLARRGWNEPAGVKRWLKALRHSRASLWEVVDLDPGRTITLRDLLAGGEPVVVDERMGSRSAALWDRVMARVLPFGDRHCLSSAILPFKPDAAEAVLERFDELLKSLRREARKAGRKSGEEIPDDETLRDFLLHQMAPVLTQEWLIHAYEAATAPPPTLLNTDGEAVVWASLRYPLRAAVEQLVERLDRSLVLTRHGDELSWDWVRSDPAPQVTAAPQPADPESEIRILTRNQLGQTVLATLRIEQDALLLEANSRERAESSRGLLAEMLGDMIGEAEAFERPIEATEDSAEPEEEGAAVLDLTPGEQAELVKTFLDDHYGRVLDQPVPLLGGKSPRQAARNKKSRSAVVNWLKQLENHEQRRAKAAGQPTYDARWLWAELGLAELRR
ncbi:MAG: hypothetical protein ACFCUQ_05740 [Kiloniellales bacterium]